MKNSSWLAGLAVALLAASARAQPTYMRGGEAPAEPAAEEPAPRPVARRGSTKSGANKQAIEVYLKGRLNKLMKTYQAQGAFGRRLNGAWDAYWKKVYEDRNRFEVRVARNRLDLFESLGSLDAGAHGSAIADYERLQTNLWRSFEDKQKEEMAAFFNKVLSDVKEFSVEQEKRRQEFMTEATDSWQAQKSSAP